MKDELNGLDDDEDLVGGNTDHFAGEHDNHSDRDRKLTQGSHYEDERSNHDGGEEHNVVEKLETLVAEKTNGHHDDKVESNGHHNYSHLGGLLKEVKAILDPELTHDDAVELSSETVLGELKSINEQVLQELMKNEEQIEELRKANPDAEG